MNGNRSVATIDGPEFIDVHPYNPLISECQIKVMYIGKNRNGSYIDKNTAIQMANSLPGCPIVGYYKEQKEDYADHGEKMVIDGDGLHFLCETKPYGFVAPDAKVWFQKFKDTDEFDNEIEREYMMTTGYLWTGQYEEAMSVIEDGKGQSMELDGESIDGHWANDAKSGLDFFIINDALFSKLCILGDDVEPCFEGASITAKEYSADSFAKTLYTMMNELKDALGQKEGGSNMPHKQEELQETETDFTVTSAGAVVEAAAEPEPQIEEPVAEPEEAPEVEATEPEPQVEEPAEEAPSIEEVEEFAKKDDEDSSDEDDSDGSKADKEEVSNEEKEPEKKHSLAEDDAIMAELAELREFKLKYERAQKDEVINKYHMLSDEDKADVVAHKDEYSLEQIDEKLALVYVRKNVDFSTVDGHPEVEEKTEEAPLLAFSLDDTNISDNAEPVDGLHEALRELFC